MQHKTLETTATTNTVKTGQGNVSEAEREGQERVFVVYFRMNKITRMFGYYAVLVSLGHHNKTLQTRGA